MFDLLVRATINFACPSPSRGNDENGRDLSLRQGRGLRQVPVRCPDRRIKYPLCWFDSLSRSGSYGNEPTPRIAMAGCVQVFGRRHDEPIHALMRPASEKRQGAKSPWVGHQGFSHFVTSMAAPAASGWSGCGVGFASSGKRRLLRGAHPQQTFREHAQKSGLSAVGTEALIPKKCGFSAQTASGQSPMRRR